MLLSISERDESMSTHFFLDLLWPAVIHFSIFSTLVDWREMKVDLQQFLHLRQICVRLPPRLSAEEALKSSSRLSIIRDNNMPERDVELDYRKLEIVSSCIAVYKGDELPVGHARVRIGRTHRLSYHLAAQHAL